MSYKSLKIIIPFLFGNLILLVLNSTHYIGLDTLFLVLLCSLCFHLSNHLDSNELCPAISSYLIFNYLFFFIAPLIQINLIPENGKFPNTMPFDYENVVLAVLSIIIFNTIFFTTLKFLKNKNPYKPIINNDKEFLDYKKIALAILIVSYIIFPISLNFLIASFHKKSFEEYSQIFNLITTKFVFSLPMFVAFYYSKYRNKFNIVLLLLGIIILIAYKNPLFDKRNAIGPIYLALLFFLKPNWFNSNAKNITILSIALIIVFPVISIITHRTSSEINTQISYYDTIKDVFISLNYDAFSNLVASISYFKNMNVVYGKQLLGSILFFVPKDIWINKPLSSGMEIGNYLMAYFMMWFNNISEPLVAEGWINFGFFGVILFAIILAFIVNLFRKWLFSSNITKQIAAVYFSFHLIFLLRGDLTNGIAYYIGPFLAFYVIPNLMLKILKIKNG